MKTSHVRPPNFAWNALARLFRLSTDFPLFASCSRPWIDLFALAAAAAAVSYSSFDHSKLVLILLL